MKEKCGFECFSCPYDDCILDAADIEETYEDAKKADAIAGADEKAEIERHKKHEYYLRNRERILKNCHEWYANNAWRVKRVKHEWYVRQMNEIRGEKVCRVCGKPIGEHSPRYRYCSQECLNIGTAKLRHDIYFKSKEQEKSQNYNYPALKAYIDSHCFGNWHIFCKRMGKRYYEVSCWLFGESRPYQKTIDAVLTLTGMTYEEAFRRDKHET